MKRFSFWSITLLLITLTVFTINRKSSAEKTVHQPIETTKPVEQVSEPVLSAVDVFDSYITQVYDKMDLSKTGLELDVFRKAVIGYYNLKDGQKLSSDKNIISIADFTKTSRSKRLWIVDLDSQKLLFNTFVAHGQGSGNDMATSFSNTPNSHQSSMGFYLTNETYFGKHGLSLKLDGMDEGYNTNARARAVVVHGAEYVSTGTIKQLGRLGRSHGCPAVPVELTKPIIETIKGGTVLFINGPEEVYTSDFLNTEFAASKYAGSVSASATTAQI